MPAAMTIERARAQIATFQNVTKSNGNCDAEVCAAQGFIVRLYEQFPQLAPAARPKPESEPEPEPSMDDILASIRRILGEDEEQATAPPPTPEPEPSMDEILASIRRILE